MLPLDLHVLSLPLAFILSQDQTLHCIISYKSQFEPWLFLILCGTPDQESIGIDALVLIVFFGTCSCTPSELPDSRRLFGTRKFLPLSLFNELLSAFRSGFRCASRLLKYPRFRKGLQRYTFFLYLQIFSQLFLTFLQTFFALNAPLSLNRLYDTTLRNSVRK